MKYLKNVATLKLDEEKCKNCGRCTEVCPHNVFTMVEGRTVIKDINRCMECGACARNCQFGAIEVKPGVGCAYAIIRGWLTGKEPTCGCSDDNSGGCC
jgi:MinD superfamily P-loop ATPase containing an inserted ferredoxin domain